MRLMFLSASGQLGGAETSLLEILASLRQAEPAWPLGLLTAGEGPLNERAAALGVETLTLPFPRSLAQLGESGAVSGGGWAGFAAQLLCAAPVAASYLGRMRRAIREFAPDVLHTNGLKMHVLGAFAQSPPALVWHAHDYLGTRPLSARLLRWRRARCAVVIANSSSVAADIRRVLGDVKVVAVPNGIDLKRFSPVGHRLDLDDLAGMAPASPGTVRVGLLGTFARWKGHATFLQALALVPLAIPLRAYIIGGPVYETQGSQYTRQELMALVRDLYIGDRVGFTGVVAELDAALRALDIVVHARTAPEPFGLVIAAAMALERSVIVSSAGGAAEMITDNVDAVGHTPATPMRWPRGLPRWRPTPSGGRGRARGSGDCRAVARPCSTGGRPCPHLSRACRSSIVSVMRVLHVYGGSLFGGIETMLVTLARQQPMCPSLMHQFALSGEGPVGPALAAAGATVHQLPMARASRPHSVWRARRALMRLLQTQRFDRVICHAAWPYAVFGRAVRRCGVPLVLWVHNVMTGTHWTERWAGRTAPDLAICNSQFSVAGLRLVFPRVPFLVILPPLQMPRLLSSGERSLVRAGLSTPEAAIVIVLAGRLEALKGHATLLDALGSLRDLPGWILWQVGGVQRPAEQEYLVSLRARAQRLGIAERVRFAGQRTDVAPVLASADIQCQPNTGPESFGLAFVEALAAGLPVVSTRLGGAMEIVDDTCGVLVPPGDIGALAEALRELIINQARRLALAQAAPARARHLCDPSVQLHTLHRALNAMNDRQDAA